LDGSDAHAVVTFPGEIRSFTISDPGPNNAITLSPDGKKIRFATTDDQTWESNLNGTGMQRFLPEFSKPMCCGQWSRDGRLYVFGSPEEGITNLWAINESGWSRFLRRARAAQLTSGPISFLVGTLSHDRKQIFAIGYTWRGELNVYDSKAKAFRI
jgi:Tol biopolymer transport system component